jgi:hypothetical protein
MQTMAETVDDRKTLARASRHNLSRLKALDHQTIIKTADMLANRVEERFPTRGLRLAARELATEARVVADAVTALATDNHWYRFTVGGVLVAGAGLVALLAKGLALNLQPNSFFELLQGLDAGFNIVVLTTLGILFVLNRETRVKRRVALDGLHLLRSVAHVIDMHQLNKDPAALSQTYVPTASSPVRDLGPVEMLRYLDYCSEMLSVTSKLAALYAQYSDDPVVIDTVNDVEQLTSSLSNKIWQKIMILNAEIPLRADGALAKARAS